MNQQINLFQPIFRAQRKVFSAMVIAQIAGIALLVLMLIYGFTYWRSRQQLDEYARLQTQQAQLASKLTQLQATLPKKTRSAALAKELQQLEDERDQKAQAVNALKDRSFGTTEGFSRQLAGLGLHRVQGLWLTDILIAGGGADFELGGEAMGARLVPQYLQQLGTDTAFDGLAFRSMRIGKPETRSRGAISFLLSTASDIKDAQIEEGRDAKSHRSH